MLVFSDSFWASLKEIKRINCTYITFTFFLPLITGGLRHWLTFQTFFFYFCLLKEWNIWVNFTVWHMLFFSYGLKRMVLFWVAFCFEHFCSSHYKLGPIKKVLFHIEVFLFPHHIFWKSSFHTASLHRVPWIN